MASSTKKILLCCVLFLILGVMGGEDSKKPGEHGEVRGRGKLAAALRDRSGGTEPTEEGKKRDTAPMDGDATEGKGRVDWEGTGDGGEITDKIESEETAREGNESGEGGCDGERGDRSPRERRIKRGGDDIPQTRNPMETNGRGRKGMDLSEEITWEGETSQEEERGEKGETGSKRWKSLSTNEPNTQVEEDEGERLEKELRAAEREERNRREGEKEGEERGDLEVELVMQREEGKRKEMEEKIGTNRGKEFRSLKEPVVKPFPDEEKCGRTPCSGGDAEMGKEAVDRVEEIDSEAKNHQNTPYITSEGRRLENRDEIRGKSNIRVNSGTTPDEKREGMELAGMTKERVEPRGRGEMEEGVEALKLEVDADGREGRKASTSGNFSMRGYTRSDGSVSYKERGFPVKAGTREATESKREENFGRSKELHYENDERHQQGGETQRKKDEAGNRTETDTYAMEEEERKMREDELEAELKSTETLGKEKVSGKEEWENMKERRNLGNSGEKVPGCCKDSEEKDAEKDPRGKEERGESEEKTSGKGDTTVTGRLGSPDMEAPEVDFETRKDVGKYEDVNQLRTEDQIEIKGGLERAAEPEKRGGRNFGLDVSFFKEPEVKSRTRETVETLPVSGPCARPSLPEDDGVRCLQGERGRHLGGENGQKEGLTAIGEVSFVVDGEKEIELPSLMEEKSRRRLKGDEGEVWADVGWETGARDKGSAVKWTPPIAGDLHPPRRDKDSEESRITKEMDIYGKNFKDLKPGVPQKDQMEISTSEANGTIYEKEIESLKNSKEEEDALPRKRSDENGSEDKEIKQKEEQKHSSIPTNSPGSTRTGEKKSSESRTFSKENAPVVVAEEGEGKERDLGGWLGLGEGIRGEIHQGAHSSPKAIASSMLHRILEVNANLNSRTESHNPNNSNEAPNPLPPRDRKAEREETSRKDGMLKEDGEKEELESEMGDIKGPRRMLMSVSKVAEMTEGVKERREVGDETSEVGYDHLKDVDGKDQAPKWKGVGLYRKRSLLQSAWREGKGVKFVARREAGVYEKDGVNAPRGSLVHVVKYSDNTSISASKLDMAKKRARNRGIVIGDKIYRVGKFGLVAVSMVENPTIATKRHGPHQTAITAVTKAINSVVSKNDQDEYTESLTSKTAIKGEIVQNSDDQNRLKSGEKINRKNRAGKTSSTVSMEGLSFATTATTDDHVSLESPPTLSTLEMSKEHYLSPSNYTAKQGTTVATPAEEEVGLSKWKMNSSLYHTIPLGCEGEAGSGKHDCFQKVGQEEEHLGYTRLQIRKPRMLDASGFGRGRGSSVGSSIVSHSSGSGKRGTLTVGMILPYIAFGQREYTKSINTAITGLSKSKVRKLDFLKKYVFSPQQVRSVMMQLTPSPTAILNSLCKEFLSVNVSAILYLMNYEKYGRSTASAQYFLQLAGYLGIPVIAWNADNSGLERRASQSSLQLQLAPSLEHQTAAMLSILERYKWHQFSIVTSQIAGHDDFVQAVRERILEMQDVFKFTILNAVLVTKPSDLSELVNSESRVVLLYCTREEALKILSAAAEYKITGENYVWVAAQSVIENRKPFPQFPIGMLGVHFDTSMPSLVAEITTAVKVYAYGVEDFVNDPRNEKLSLNTQLSCEGVGDSRWKVGDRFFKYLRNVSVEGEHGKPNIEFTADGVLKAAELKIMNLRPGVSKQLVWEEIGVWKSWEREGLDIKDIVWPGGSHTPPQGVPEKFHMRITFLEEPPYINVAPPDPITGKCSINRGVLCRFAAETEMSGMDMLQAHRNASYYQCCSGFCIDLLEKFSEELGFTYELVRVEDGKWGTLENGKWNGLIADLINRKTDMVMTSLMINSDREAVVDFTVPFMESGIAIVVAKRTGIISPTAFLEPFDSASWMLVGLVAIQVSAFTIFLFEWLSPSGFNMKVAPSTNHRFSLFRTYWLVWAVLFQAAVHVDCPKGFTARFMTNVWAMFAVVFLAIYTANLAAFMITREEFHEFSGIDDHRLAKPFSHKPMFKFGTIPWGHTDSTLKKYFREMHAYMKRHNRSIVGEGIEAVLSGELDAFIYDGTVLDYLVSQDEDCRLLTVGSWYAMTGYGLAFQRNSKYVRMFNQRLLDFRENGDLERLRRYWMTGSCKPGKQERKSSDPLALEQFLSAFLLLMSGILLAAFLLLLEHLYFKYVRHHLARTDRGGCCALVSLSMGKSLTFRGAVYEAQDMYKNNRRGPSQHQHSGGHRAFSGIGRNCNCSYCEGLHTLWATRRELEACRLRIRHLEKQMEAHGIRPLPPPPPQSLPSLLPPPGSSPGNRRYLNDEDALRTRDMTRNHVTSTEYCGQLYRPCRTEIAEMETVL